MKILHCIKIAILMIHQAVEGITGAIGGWKIIGDLELGCFGFEIFDLFSHLVRLNSLPGGPFLEASQTLPKLTFGRGLIDIPQLT